MGTLRDDNGDDLPGLPDWANVVIPDDASELAVEAEQVRRELAHKARRQRLLRSYTGSGVGFPLLIVTIAVVAAMVSLFAVAWPRRPTAQQPGPAQSPPSATVVPDITLYDAAGVAVILRDLRPAVFVLVGGCTCTDLLAGTVAATAEHDIAVLVVGDERVPPLAPALSAPHVRAVADPAGELTRAVAAGPAAAAATVLLINPAGTIVRRLDASRSVEEFRRDLSGLSG